MEEIDKYSWRDLPLISHIVDHEQFYRGTLYATTSFVVAGVAIATGIELFATEPNYSLIINGAEIGGLAGLATSAFFATIGKIIP